MAAMDPQQLWALVQQKAQETGQDPEMLFRMVMQESGGDPAAFNENEGARGLMQVRPGAAADIGMSPEEHAAMQNDPAAQIGAGAGYLAHQAGQLPPDAPEEMRLSAYNAGVRGQGLGRGRGYAEQVMAQPGPPGSALPVGGPEDEMAQLETLGMGPGGPPSGPPGPMMSDPPMGPPPAGGPGMQEGTVDPTRYAGDMPPGLLDAGPAGPTPPDPMGAPAMAAPPGESPGISSAAPAGGGRDWMGILQALAIPMAGMIGGRRNPMLSFATGMLKGQAAKKMSEWEQEQKVKYEQDKQDMEDASTIMENLQGLDLNAILEQETDPNRRAMLQKATDEIDKIGEKYAQFLDPNSEGGSAITANEARKIKVAADRVKREVQSLETGKRRMLAGEEARFAGEKTAAEEKVKRESYVQRAKDLLDLQPKVDIDGQMVPASQAVQLYQARAQKARADYFSAKASGDSAGANKFSLAIANNASKLIPMWMMGRANAEKKGDMEMAAFYARKLQETEALVEKYGGGGAEGGLTGQPSAADSWVQDEMARQELSLGQ